ncbi:MAG: HAMP domain-containing sensor histidine kinase [Bacteroidota bacterium]
MKLFTRYNRINLLATVSVFLLSGISFYFLLQYVLSGQVDEDLKIEQHEVETYTRKYHALPEIIPVRDQQTDYRPATGDEGERLFSTVHLREGHHGEDELFRRLTFSISTGTQWYRVSVTKSLEGTDDMIRSIVTITLITILLILAISFLINRLVLKKLWQPFYTTLSIMRSFELGKKTDLPFASTNIEEFTIMNETLRHATAKAHADYQYLKEFTENAAHELQTPLAVIRSKLDLLIQDEHLSETQGKAVQGAYESIERLARLNKGLLLLTKIENGQYAETSQINLSEKVKEKIEQFEEITAAKNIKVTTNFIGPGIITINPELAEMILNNLLSNAIRYNRQGGLIKIVTDENILEISNTGAVFPLDEGRLFKRFAKTGQSSEGIGLGLAIVKQAAVYAGFEIRYRFEKQMHLFILTENYQSTIRSNKP